MSMFDYFSSFSESLSSAAGLTSKAPDIPFNVITRKVFDKCDVDGIGALSFEEFKIAVYQMGEENKSSDYIRELFDEIDTEKRNTITYYQFHELSEQKYNYDVDISNALNFDMISLGFSNIFVKNEDNDEILTASRVATPRARDQTMDRPPDSLAFTNTSQNNIVVIDEEDGEEGVVSSRIVATDNVVSTTSEKKQDVSISSLLNTQKRSIDVEVPVGAVEGELADFLLPGGRIKKLTVPIGAKPGERISIEVADHKKGSILSSEQVKKAREIFRRMDFDNSGGLDNNEVKMALEEMGMDSSAQTVESLIKEFDADGNGTIDFDEFKVICANSPIGDFNWSYIDSQTMAKIEQSAKGVGELHEGYTETLSFIRVLDKGMHFLRLDRSGVPRNLVLKLSKRNDAIKYQLSGGQVASFRLSTLWGVAEPFQDEHDDTMNLVPAHLAPLTILLVFAMCAADEYLSKIPTNGVVDPNSPVGPTQTGVTALKLAERHVDKRKLMETCHTKKGGLINVSSYAAHCVLASALTGVSPLKCDPLSRSNQPVAHGVLLLVADSLEEKEQALDGLRNLVKFQQFHAIPENALPLAPPTIAGEAANIRPQRRKDIAQEVDKNDLGAIGRFLQMFHLLYRPHHHPNHPAARFHTNIEAEVIYDESYEVSAVITHGQGKDATITEKKLKMPMPVFRPNMYVVATIKSYDHKEGTYDLTYSSGPYLADENPNGLQLFRGPEDASSAVFHFKGVKQSLISVDIYNNFGTSLPFFIVGISFIQLVCFISWAISQKEAVSMYNPVSGPEWSWLRIMSDFPNCDNLRADFWRLGSYQFVHKGLVHLMFNVLMQLLFGLPLNMVHGSLRFGLIYELGVIFGALCFITVDGGFNDVVGCSGGVYCILGMHLAEIFINWNLENRGLMNHWIRLLIVMCVLGVDAYQIFTSPSETTSYSAHGGGLLAGLLCGIVFLDTFETTWWNKWLNPLATFFMIALPALLILYYLTEDFPPPPLAEYLFPSGFEDTPCCWQAMECSSVDSSDYEAMYCKLASDDVKQLLFSEASDEEVSTCQQMKDAITDYIDNE